MERTQAPGHLAAGQSRPAPWTTGLAFVLVYLSWGTTYYAIRAGVHGLHLPPALFGGTRVCLAGWVLLGYLRLRGEPVGISWPDLLRLGAGGVLLFTLGNGLITAAMALDEVPSNFAAVLAASSPLWMAMMEGLLPRGERLSPWGWLGLLMGLGGICLLLIERNREPASAGETNPLGPLLVLGSAFFWSVGALMTRYLRHAGSHLASSAYQMIVGGGGLALVGLLLGEGQDLTSDKLTLEAGFDFVYLLIVGSLVGFVAFNWLLGHVSAPLVGTHAYVNPVVALLVGWCLGNEEITGTLLGSMAIILLGVGLVRGAGMKN